MKIFAMKIGWRYRDEKTVLQTGGGSDKFDLTASSLGGVAREYKMYFKDETTQEWLVEYHYIIIDPPIYFHTRPILLYMGDLLEHLQNKLKILFKKSIYLNKMDLAGPFNN